MKFSVLSFFCGLAMATGLLAQSLNVTSTGINGTAIGATTPGTGNFTSLRTSAGIVSTLTGGDAAVIRYDNSNQPLGLLVGGDSGQAFLGGNLTFASHNVFNYATSNGAWAIGDPGGGGNFRVFVAPSGSIGAAAFNFTTAAPVGIWSTAGLSLLGAAHSGYVLTVNTSATGGVAIDEATSAGTPLRFQTSSGLAGYVATSGTTAFYGTTSDLRLKHSFRPWTLGDAFDRIRIGEFDWNAGGSGRGVFAQDLYKIFPDAVIPGDEGDKISKPWGVDYGKLTIPLIAELQALRKRVAQLEAAPPTSGSIDWFSCGLGLAALGTATVALLRRKTSSSTS
jgi:hypothetical protein